MTSAHAAMSSDCGYERALRATLRRVDAVQIGSASDHLRLSAEPDDPALDYLVADLSVDGLSATKRVYAHYASGWRDLEDFLASLAAVWRGWSGTREWTSLSLTSRSSPP